MTLWKYSLSLIKFLKPTRILQAHSWCYTEMTINIIVLKFIYLSKNIFYFLARVKTQEESFKATSPRNIPKAPFNSPF